MIVFTRTASIAPGKAGAAVAFAHQVAAYHKSSVGTDIEVLMPVGGNPYRITWTSRHQNLGELEEINLKTLADQKYAQLVTTGNDIFIAGSVFDTIWRVI